MYLSYSFRARILSPKYLKFYSVIAKKIQPSNSECHVNIKGHLFPRDEMTNVSEGILTKLHQDVPLHLRPKHPIATIRHLIERQPQFGKFLKVHHLSPVVTPTQNFDHLLIPKDHPSRNKSDTFYVNRSHLLRTHTTAHQVELLKELEKEGQLGAGGSGADSTLHQGFLITGDVYRRDQVDNTHYPVFHQMDGVQLFRKGGEAKEELSLLKAKYPQLQGVCLGEVDLSESSGVHPRYMTENKSDILAVIEHLKLTLYLTIETLFREVQFKESSLESKGDPFTSRFNKDFFPFTQPSFEMEILKQNKWLEILGAGVIRPEVLDYTGNYRKSEVNILPKFLKSTYEKGLEETHVGWAFGMGLERLALFLYQIPDIRLLWSQDDRFLKQFESDCITPFKPFSLHPPCYKDISFWIADPEAYHHHYFYDLVRDVAGDLVEDIQQTDSYFSDKMNKQSYTFRICYRDLHRNLTNEEINKLQQSVRLSCKHRLPIELR